MALRCLQSAAKSVRIGPLALRGIDHALQAPPLAADHHCRVGAKCYARNACAASSVCADAGNFLRRGCLPPRTFPHVLLCFALLCFRFASSLSKQVARSDATAAETSAESAEEKAEEQAVWAQYPLVAPIGLRVGRIRAHSEQYARAACDPCERVAVQSYGHMPCTGTCAACSTKEFAERMSKMGHPPQATAVSHTRTCHSQSVPSATR